MVEIIELIENAKDFENLGMSRILKNIDAEVNDHATERNPINETPVMADSSETGLSAENCSIEEEDVNSEESRHSHSSKDIFADAKGDVEINGRRIVDLTFVFQQLREQCGKHNSSCECSFSSLRLEKYVDRGLRTQLFFKCDDCDYSSSVWTDRDDPCRMGINEGAVCGTITAGTGFQAMEEMLATMAIPSMSHVTYRKYRNILYPKFVKCSEEEMQSAAAEEQEIAIKEGHVINGIPYITVVADGYWAKRSYRGGKYDALSGTALIIGMETAKVLHVGVRNKYCAVCAKAAQLMKEPSDHECYKNWGRDQSSTAMEADIIVEGFKESVEKRNLIYKTLVADGDASTFQSIRDANPYAEYGVIVNKFECNNHLFRNFCRKIRESASSKMTSHPDKNVMGKGKFQSYVEASALRMRTLITEIRDERKKDSIPDAQKSAKLQKDIFVVFNHVFGDHSQCSQLPIKCEPNKDEINLMPQLHKSGAYTAVFNAVSTFSCHAESLLEDVTNNIAESANAVVNKLNSGKRINHCARNSFQMRSYGGIVQHNTQELVSRVHLSAGMEVPAAVSKMEDRRKHQVSINRGLQSVSKRRQWRGTDKDYGPSAKKPDMAKDAYTVCVERHFDKLNEHQKRRAEIERDTVEQSNCEFWHQLRTEIITASKFGPICRMLESTSCSKMVTSIRYPKVLDTAALQFGLDNEQNAIQALQVKLRKPIAACGLFIDAEIPYIGASPDGLIDDDGIVEVKCPHSAKDMPPEAAIQQIPHLKSIFDKRNNELMNKNHVYYYQVQGQLHVTNRKYCIFGLWTTVGIKYVKVLKDDEFWTSKMEPFLTRFYLQCLLPEIIDSRRNRSMPIREPEYVVLAKAQLTLKKDTKSKRTCENTIEDYSQTTGDSIGIDHEDAGVNVAKKPCTDANWMTINVDDEIEPLEQERGVLEVIRQNISTQEVVQDILPITNLLNDTSIDLFQTIVHENSDFTFHPTSYFAYHTFIRPCTTSKDMHIIGGNHTRHWCCVYYDGSTVMIYDSLGRIEYHLLHEEEKRYLRKRFPHLHIDDIVFQPVTRQPDPYSCGVYAAAFATTIALGGDPAQEVYSSDVQKMRAHLLSIITTRQLTAFPMK